MIYKGYKKSTSPLGALVPLYHRWSRYFKKYPYIIKRKPLNTEGEYMTNYTTEKEKSQEKELFRKLVAKKKNNEFIVNFLMSIGETKRANNVQFCGSHIGITTIEGIPKIVKADFCRERLCLVCAWRRQARFMAQMFPVLDILCKQNYRFLFATLTIKNMGYSELEDAINDLLSAYEKLRHRRKIKRSWMGIVRSVELTYNAEDNTFHPHIHLLIAVKENYFNNSDLYITQEELSLYWKECLNVDYCPVVDIRSVDATEKATVETLKYSLKPTKAREALSAFFYILRGRRLISFCGVFQKIRAELKYSDFENVLIDKEDVQKGMKYNLYTFDATGGVYRLSQEYILN